MNRYTTGSSEKCLSICTAYSEEFLSGLYDIISSDVMLSQICDYRPLKVKTVLEQCWNKFFFIRTSKLKLMLAVLNLFKTLKEGLFLTLALKSIGCKMKELDMLVWITVFN